MPELSIIEIIKYALSSLVDSKVFILLVLELSILIIMFTFSKLMNKKVVKVTSILACLIVLGFYITNYVDTIVIFMNNVSTKLIEFIYFPTTLEFMIVMFLSFVIMGITLLNKDSKPILKFINTALPLSISFLFFCIIEYINKNNIAFDEFSVFSNPVMMSLYELSMGLFISWLFGLIIYKVDMFILNRVSLPKKVSNEPLVTINIETDEEIEMPKLKESLIK